MSEIEEDLKLALELLEAARPVDFWRDEPKKYWTTQRLNLLIKYGVYKMDTEAQSEIADFQT